MEIAKEESRAYKTLTNVADLANALRRHVANEMRLEFERGHIHCKAQQIVMLNPDRKFIEWSDGNRGCYDVGHHYTTDDWERAAHEALMNGS